MYLANPGTGEIVESLTGEGYLSQGYIVISNHDIEPILNKGCDLSWVKADFSGVNGQVYELAVDKQRRPLVGSFFIEQLAEPYWDLINPLVNAGYDCSDKVLKLSIKQIIDICKCSYVEASDFKLTVAVNHKALLREFNGA